MGSAVGMLLALNCYICRHRSCRQQPSHLSVINPYSPLAAFLPFTTYCLKLKRKKKKKEGRGEGTKITKLRKERDRERKGKELKIRWGFYS